MEKLSSLLSDEESVRQLSELAEMMNAETGTVNTEKTERSGNIPDISEIVRLTGVIGSATSDDKNSELLLALKPHLSEERQKRVDNAVKMMKIAALIRAAKESGLLDDML